MIFARFGDLLRGRMGLNPASIGPSAVERAVRTRIRACHLDDPDHYWDHLQRTPSELQALIEEVVVPETWFFRDPQAFRAMERFVLGEWGPRSLAGTLRVMSIPCSTGEEPYTMAMTLLDGGVSPDRLVIDAIDISAHALDRARRGVYGRNSFRAKDLGYRDRHFDAVDGGFRIRDRARAPVRFHQSNLLDPDFQLGALPYDVIFCRNLLIYFDVETQDRAITALVRLLAPQGMLFIGHSEAGLMARHGLVSAKIPMAFAFRREPAMGKPAPAPRVPAVPPPRRAAAVRTPIADRAFPDRPPASRRARAELTRPDPAPPRPPVAPDLDALRRMADRGQLAEAEQACQAHLRDHGASADVFLLLGLIADARGAPAEAIGHYRKVLYLQPDHVEALGHLALLLGRQGDAPGAQRLRERMARLDSGKVG